MIVACRSDSRYFAVML